MRHKVSPKEKISFAETMNVSTILNLHFCFLNYYDDCNNCVCQNSLSNIKLALSNIKLAVWEFAYPYEYCFNCVLTFVCKVYRISAFF